MKISPVSKPLWACLIGIAAVIAAGSVAAVTPATRIEFDGLVHFCDSGPDGNLNQWVTGNPLIDGFETNTASVNVSPTGVVIHLDRTLEPAAYFGSTWEIVQTNHFNPNGFLSSHGVGHGTGALKGMTMKITAAGRVSVENPCSDRNSGVISGVIIAPAVHN